MSAEHDFESMPVSAREVLSLRATQRFGFIDRIQILLSGRVAIEQRIRVEVNEGNEPWTMAGVARWTTNWPWRWE